VKDIQLQMKLPGVPQAKQGREVAPQWAWTEAVVWTERMLATLERGITGGKWYSVMDKVWKITNLQRAVQKVAQGKSRMKADGRKCRRYAEQSAQRLPILQGLLQSDRYQPKPAQRIWIPKLGSKEMRPLGIPEVENRVVEMAIRNVIEPIFEHSFAPHSYGFRPGRGAKDALRRVRELLRQGKVWVVDADLKGYFDSIPQDKLMEAVSEHLADGKLLELIKKFLKQGVMETGKGWTPTETGTPQGAVLSPLLANIYLNPLDHLMARLGWEMVRYADDFVILCESQEQAEQALAQIRQWVEKVGLVLHPTKTRLVDASQRGGFDFLGYHFERGMRWPREKSLKKFKDAIRDKTGRMRPGSMQEIVADTNRTIRGWMGYFKHSIATGFPELDKWVRGRLRTIQRKRNKGKGRARGQDHQRWPNAYFVGLGLLSMVLIRAEAANLQRQRRTH
jgi:RNA-directed DNA polymerase